MYTNKRMRTNASAKCPSTSPLLNCSTTRAMRDQREEVLVVVSLWLAIGQPRSRPPARRSMPLSHADKLASVHDLIYPMLGFACEDHAT